MQFFISVFNIDKEVSVIFLQVAHNSKEKRCVFSQRKINDIVKLATASEQFNLINNLQGENDTLLL